eukprot:scaffold104738_cov67-Phaeocystis_antarctica.AAC.3
MGAFTMSLRAEGDDDAIGRVALRQRLGLHPELQRKPVCELGRKVCLSAETNVIHVGAYRPLQWRVCVITIPD